MIFLIGGATHTGKPLLARKLLERRHYPRQSLDHLKMGLIRSENFIRRHYTEILDHAEDIERRPAGDTPSRETRPAENRRNLELGRRYDPEYILIDDFYEIAWDSPAAG